MRENITPHQRALRAAAERTPAAEQERSQDHCPRCNRLIALQTNGALYPHGPRGNNCLGSGQVVKPALKRDVNGKALVAGDTVVWETEDGLSHHAGYVIERQDTDPIDIRVQPRGSAGGTYVVIKARRLRIAMVGNGGNYTVADLVAMADALENPQPGAVTIPSIVVEDDQTVSEAKAPVTGPKFEVMSAAHHRNGSGGRPFYVGLVKRWEDGVPHLFQVIATPEPDQDDVSKMTFDTGEGIEIYVTDLMVIAQQGTVAFGRNSWRGDNFLAEARAIVIQTRADWDNQMLRLSR